MAATRLEVGETGGNVLHRSHTACGETRELSVAEASELSVVDAVAFTPLAKALISFGAASQKAT